ncbi:MAG: Ig-like domain-containing protein [Candidatus Marinimicrobia bacterium]|nr:Ig-like domain-containing protein [Candidatus Neomarinimicrobiota bacterium]
MKRLIIIILILSSFLAAQQIDTITYKICVNAGHGGHTSNDRPPISPAGYWESEGNLTRALVVETLMTRYGVVDVDDTTRAKFAVVMTRRHNRRSDNLALSSICALANSNYCDWMQSIHSNATGLSNSTRHSTLLLYPGPTGDARINGLPGYPKYPQQMTMSSILANNIRQALQTTGTQLAGDWTFYGTNQPYLGVFRTLQVPGTLSEGTHHDYYVETYRLQNMDFRINEAWGIFMSFLTHFELPRPQHANLAGIVRTYDETVVYNHDSGDDKYKPVDSLEITLYPIAAPAESRSYFGNTTMYVDKYTPQWSQASGYAPINPDNWAAIDNREVSESNYDYYMNGYNNNHGYNQKNGFYLFDSLAYGTYTLCFQAAGYWPDTTEITIDGSKFFWNLNYFLTTSVPPYVKNIVPKANEPMHPAWEPLVITFSHVMDTASFRSAFTLSPDAEMIIRWSNDLKQVTLTAAEDSLEVNTQYTLTLQGAQILGNRGQNLDGNGDGNGGDDYSQVFTTSHPDIYPPKVAEYYPPKGQYFHDLQPILTYQFNELLDVSEDISDKFAFYRVSGGLQELDCDYDIYSIGKTTLVSLFPKEALVRNYRYTRYAYSGLKDLAGNISTSDQSGTLLVLQSIPWYADTLVIDAFDAGLTTHWKQPGFSGSTVGLLSGETSANTRYVNHCSNSGHSMGIYYKFDPEVSAALARIWLDGTSTPAKRYFTNESILQAWVFGDGSGNLFRFAVDDPSGTGISEVSPWYPIDFTGWRLIKWDLRDGETGEWPTISDGVLNGQLNFDSFQIAYVDSLGNNEGTIYIEDLIVLTPGGVGVADCGVPDEYILEQNYPNPFNPVTLLRYSLPEDTPVQLAVYDIKGRHIRTLVNGRQAAGVYQVEFHAGDLPSGIYLARLQAGTEIEHRKMLLVK